jgi:hypothetical protein
VGPQRARCQKHVREAAVDRQGGVSMIALCTGECEHAEDGLKKLDIKEFMLTVTPSFSL